MKQTTNSSSKIDPIELEIKLYLLVLELHGFGSSKNNIIRQLLWNYLQDHQQEIAKGPARNIFREITLNLQQARENSARGEMEKIFAELAE